MSTISPKYSHKAEGSSGTEAGHSQKRGIASLCQGNMPAH